MKRVVWKSKEKVTWKSKEKVIKISDSFKMIN